MSHTIEEIRRAMYRMHWLALCGDPRGRSYMSVPADPQRDADLILAAAIDELEGLRSKAKSLDEAIGKWLLEAEALGQETAGVMRDLRRSFGPVIQSVWSMGPFFGPCAHGRDPYTRCEECEDLSPRAAFLRARDVRFMAELSELRQSLQALAAERNVKDAQ